MHDPNFRAGNTIINDWLGDFKFVASLLKSCAAQPDINRGKFLHCSIVKIGLTSCQFASKALLNMYAKCEALHDCKRLFHELGSSDHDPVFWNILLSGFAGSRGYAAETLRLFGDMHSANEPKFSEVTAAIVLPVCARLGDVFAGKSVHCYMVKSGLERHTLVGNALVSMYAKCGLVCEDAYAAFDGICDKDVVSWNAIIAGFSENKLVDNALRLFSLMLKGPIRPNDATIVNILPVCASLDRNIAFCIGKQIHCYALRHHEFFVDVSVCNALISLYLRVGEVEKAELLFWRLRLRDLVSWNAIISGYSSNGQWAKALKLFHELLSLQMFGPDSVTIMSILLTCAHLKNLEVGRQIHGFVVQHPFLYQDTSVMNALISFYAKCDNVDTAYRIFMMIPRRDVISWNSMLDALVEGGHNTLFVELFEQILGEGIKPDSVTILITVHFCVNISKIDKVKETHGYSIRCGFSLSDVEPTISNALLDAYAKCGNIEYAFKVFQSLSEKWDLVTFNSMISCYVNSGLHEDAHKIFYKMPATDITTWNLMVRACAENDCPDKALCLFHKLQDQGMKPDAVTIMSLLPVCAQMASVLFIKQCHGYVVRFCFDDIRLEGALLDVYAKCGSLDDAYRLFQSNVDKDLVMFTAMIRGYAMHGMGEEALRIFSYMLELGIKPDHIVITALLSACSHAGLIDEGLKIFYEIEEYGMKPTMEQYSCAVDILARGGRIADAYSLVTRMPTEANANVWGALLGACRTHHEVELGRSVADRLFQIEANNIGNYVILSNLYAADARWDEVLDVRKRMRVRDLKKPAGCSWIEVERRKNIFVVGDSSHPQRTNIYSILSTLNQQIKEPFRLNQWLDLQQLECHN